MKIIRMLLIVITLLGISSFVPLSMNGSVIASDSSDIGDTTADLSNPSWLQAKFEKIFLSDNPEKYFNEEPSNIQEAILSYISINGVFKAGPIEIVTKESTLLDDTGSNEVYIVQPGYIEVGGILVHIWDCGERVGWSWDGDIITSINKNESWMWLGIGANGTQTSSESFMWQDYSSFYKTTDWTMGWYWLNWDVSVWLRVDAGGGYDGGSSVNPLF
jgi:hypothetical protein